MRNRSPRLRDSLPPSPIRSRKQPARYALEGSIAITGALVQWLRDNLRMIGSSAEVETLAREVEDNGGVFFVPAFSGLYAPHWNERARGTIAGLTRYATRSHIARAALEATAYQTREVLTAMEQDSSIPITELRVDGGMVVNELLMQFQADIVNVPVVRPKITETTALGAAYAAGLAVGYWRSRDDLLGNWQVDKRWTPQMNENRRARCSDRGRRPSAGPWIGLTRARQIRKRQMKGRQHAFGISRRILWHDDHDLARQWRCGQCRAAAVKGRKIRLDRNHRGLVFCSDGRRVRCARAWQRRASESGCDARRRRFQRGLEPHFDLCTRANPRCDAGATLVWLTYWAHWEKTPDSARQVGMFLHNTGHQSYRWRMRSLK